MNINDLISAFTEFLSNIDTPQEPNQNRAEFTPVTVQQTDNTPEQLTMIPPLQQKLELLKKSVGVDSAFDTQPEEENIPSSIDQDELERIKKIAGITAPAAIVQIAGEDTDIE